jgi:hypothetical protein
MDAYSLASKIVACVSRVIQARLGNRLSAGIRWLEAGYDITTRRHNESEC